MIIGGGLLLSNLINELKNWGTNINVIMSKRHASEYVSQAESLTACVEKLGVKYYVFDSSNEFETKIKGSFNEPDLVLCLGPSWIFSNSFVDKFENKLFNINCIPVPKFRGGAHFTWQILQGNKEISVVIQKITKQLDRGDIVFRSDATLKVKRPRPIDYFEAYENFVCESIKNFMNCVVDLNFKNILKFDEVEKDMQYFPRLNTDLHGWIDWSWDGEEIEQFVRAFSLPYAGAKTQCSEREVRILDAHFSPGENNHPFCQGLVINTYASVPRVMVNNGILSLIEYNSETPIRSGDRLYTPNKFIENAKKIGTSYD